MMMKALGPEVLQMCQSLMVRMLRGAGSAQRPMAFKQHANDVNTFPIPSMGQTGIFTYMKWLIFYGRCSEIYHTWILWV